MRGLALFLAGVALGVLCSRRPLPYPIDLALEVDELAGGGSLRRTLLLRAKPVSEGVSQAPR